MDVRKEHFWGPEGKGAGEALGKQLAAKMTVARNSSGMSE